MSLLRDIQNAAIDNKTSLETLLRKCLVLSSRLQNEPLKKWVQAELNGYEDADLPAYRQSDGHCFGNFSGMFGKMLRSYPIPEATIPKKHKEIFTRVNIREGVSSLELLLERNSDDGGQLMIPWNANAAIVFGDKIYQGYQLLNAWTEVPVSLIAGVLSTVRNRILDFALEIEAENPAAGEAEANTTPIPPEQVSQIVNNNIFGNVGNLAAGHHFSQKSSATINQGDMESLEKALLNRGVPPDEITEIKSALVAEPVPASNGFGPKVNSWIGKMVTKAAEGTWGIGTAVAGSLLTSYLKQYYGLP